MVAALAQMAVPPIQQESWTVLPEESAYADVFQRTSKRHSSNDVVAKRADQKHRATAQTRVNRAAPTGCFDLDSGEVSRSNQRE